MAGPLTYISLPPFSDGDLKCRPNQPIYHQTPHNTTWLEKLGTLWMESKGEAVPGVRYSLRDLPAGYTSWVRPRQSAPHRTDRYLWGHPCGRAFDSPNRFFPHLLSIMNNDGKAVNCKCDFCTGKRQSMASLKDVFPRTLPIRRKQSTSTAGHSPRSANSEAGITKRGSRNKLPNPKGRPKAFAAGKDTTRVDEEGTPDVYRNLIDQLKKEGQLNEMIEESLSLDWRAEQEIMTYMIQAVRDQHQFVPRAGEFILYVRELPQNMEICYDSDSDKFMLYNHETKRFEGQPAWEAGVVGQPPAEDVEIDDLVMENDKQFGVNYSGIRIEPLDHPNRLIGQTQPNRYKYVPLYQTRPFIFWQDYVGTYRQNWHPTVENAMTCMSTVSLVDKFRFKGSWPNATVYCKGIYIGAELFVVGDTVRLVPYEDSTTDILVIKAIRLNLSNLDLASDNDWDEGRPYNGFITITGQGYTQDISRSYLDGGMVEEDVVIPEAISKFSEVWYPIHPPSHQMQVPLKRVMSRLYDFDAMVLWFPQLSPDGTSILPPDISRGDVSDARKFARKNDQRIAKEAHLGSEWFWGDSRAESLGLHSLNGVDVGLWDRERDPKEWHTMTNTLTKMEQKGKLRGEDGEEEAGTEDDQANGSGSLLELHKLRVRNFLMAGAVSGDESSAAESNSVKKRGTDHKTENGTAGGSSGISWPGPNKRAKVMVVIEK